MHHLKEFQSTIEGVPSVGWSGNEFQFGDSRLIVLSSTFGSASYTSENPIMCVSLSPTCPVSHVDLKALCPNDQPADSVAIMPAGTITLSKQVSLLSSLAIDVGPSLLDEWMQLAQPTMPQPDEFLPFRCDRIAASAARAILEHLELSRTLNSDLEAKVIPDLLRVLGIRFVSRLKISNAKQESGTATLSWRHRLDESRLLPAINLVTERLGDSTLKVADLASEAGMSSAHFSPIFKRHLNISPYAYIRKKRIERGVALVRQSQMPLSQIATTAGFADQSHMTTVFSQALGLTPNEIRQLE